MFEGLNNPLVAEDWIQELEKIFMLMDYIESQKVICVAFMLKKKVYHMDESPIERTQFKVLFLKKYFPVVKRDEKEAKFLRLVQENMSLVVYKYKFDELACYAPHLIDTEEYKGRHFKKGLKLELYSAIVMLRLPTYINVLQQVQLIAKDNIPKVTKTIKQSFFTQKKP